MNAGRVAWKEAGWVFGLSRLVILLVSYFGLVVFPPKGQTMPLDCSTSFDPCLRAWYHWDAVAYVNIAHHGYTYTPDTAFFPFWPLLEHFGGLLLGGFFPNSYYIAGLLLANICFYFTLVLLYHLLAEDFEAGIARHALGVLIDDGGAHVLPSWRASAPRVRPSRTALKTTWLLRSRSA